MGRSGKSKNFFNQRKERRGSLDVDVDDLDILNGLIKLVNAALFNVMDDFHALDDAAKHSVLVIKTRESRDSDKELTAIGVLSCIGHRQNTWTIVAQIVVKLVLKLSSPDTGTASSVAHGISSLDDKTLDDTMESEAVVVFVPAVHHKVLDGFGTEIGKQLEGHVTLCGVDRGKRAQTDFGRLDDS